jgi:hypothetical protein
MISTRAQLPRPGSRLTCPAGCAIGGGRRDGAGCQATLRRDLAHAIRLARRAAQRLESKPLDARTIRLYRVAFGYHPGRRLPAARRFADVGALSAHRFRLVAAALERRVIRFECRGQPAAHPNRNAAVPRELGGRPNTTVIWLYPRYWSRTRPVRMGVLIHEALHLFASMRDQDTAPRRGLNAHCYEWLVLVLNGLAAEPSDLYSCRLTPPG